MAKSLRARTRKSNKTKLRNRVNGPLEAARTERLSTKLLKIATDAQFKASKTVLMDEIDNNNIKNKFATRSKVAVGIAAKEMQVDDGFTGAPKQINSSRSIHTPKKRRGKASASIVFATHLKKRKIGSRKWLP